MGARGPKSNLTSLAGFRDKPAPPDATLTEAQAEIWTRIAATKPGTWFNQDDMLLLSELCRAVDMCNRLAVRIDATDVRQYEILARVLAIRDKEVRRVTVLATKLRLTPQSRYDKGAASTASKLANRGPRPWEDDDIGAKFFGEAGQ